MDRERVRPLYHFGLRTLLAASLVCGAACAGKPPPEARPHPATWVNDVFQVEQGMPMREVKKDQEFFFKKCELNDRHAHFPKTDYNCNDNPF